ncbi:MAG: hypothetical protein LBQ41_04610 [Candidatus Ancillula sp.]|jgi:hypothetical protein|nr:hypothetical protein [Candidatus Ancillula sp.]
MKTESTAPSMSPVYIYALKRDPDFDYWSVPISSLSSNLNAEPIFDFWATHGKLRNLVRKIVFNNEVNAKINLRDSILAKYLLRKSVIHQNNIDPRDPITIFYTYQIYQDLHFFLSKHVQKMLSEGKNVLFFTDSVAWHKGQKMQTALNIFQKFPHALTYSDTEAKEYGLQYLHFNKNNRPPNINEAEKIEFRDFSLLQCESHLEKNLLSRCLTLSKRCRPNLHIITVLIVQISNI